MLAARIERQAPEPEAEPTEPRVPRKRARKPKPAAPTDAVTDFLRSRQGKALQRQVVRGIFGMLRKKL